MRKWIEISSFRFRKVRRKIRDENGDDWED